MYDVIVTGAGAAGSTAAKILADNGYNVLLAEKFKMPRYKSCSGQIIRKTAELIQEYFNEKIPESVMCIPFENHGMIFTDDKGKEFKFEQSGFNVWRSSFDKWLADKAAESGAEIRDCTAAVSCSENDGIVTVTLKGDDIYTEQAKYVINCEGAVCSLKRKLTNRKQQYIKTYQTFNQGSIDLDYHYFYAYLQPEFSEYDAWFNVKDNQLVLGVAVKEESKAEKYYGNFVKYMEIHHNLKIEKQLRIDRWIMPHIRSGCGIDYGTGRILFAGEAAGFLNPMGEGISAGIESGYHAAQSVIKNYDTPEFILDDYKSRTYALHVYMQRQWNFAANMADTFREMKEV